jgi:hypothetical protein
MHRREAGSSRSYTKSAKAIAAALDVDPAGQCHGVGVGLRSRADLWHAETGRSETPARFGSAPP